MPSSRAAVLTHPAEAIPAAPGGPEGERPRPIRVMLLLHTIGYGGVETVLLNWVSHLDHTRFLPFLVCFSNPGSTEKPFLDAAEALGLPVRTIPWRRSKPVWQASTALARLLREDRIDVLHTHNTYADLVGLLAAKRCGIRSLITLYVWGDFGWRRNVLQWMDRKMLPFFDLVSAHCKVTYEQTLRFGVPAARLRLHLCGFEAQPYAMSGEERTRERLRRGAEPEALVLINVARLYPEKQQRLLLDLFRVILDRRPEARLWIAGVGPLEAELRAHAASLGLGEAVRFLGFEENLPALLALAEVHVNTSSAEGVPLAICSAMAAGLPVVATEVGGLPEILDEGRAGVLVPFADTSRFIEEVMRMLDEPDRRLQFGRSAQQFIHTDYALTTAVRRLEDTYAELAGRTVLSAKSSPSEETAPCA